MKKFYIASRVSFVFYYTFFMWIITCLPVLSQRYNLYYIKYQSIFKSLSYSFAEGLLVYSASIFVIGLYVLFPNIIRKILLSISGFLSVFVMYASFNRGTSISDQLIISIVRSNITETTELLSLSDIIIVFLLTVIVLLPVWVIKFKKYEFKNMLSIRFWYKKSILFLFFLIFGIFINVEVAFSEHGYFPIRPIRTLYPPINYLNAMVDFTSVTYKTYTTANNLIPLYDDDNKIRAFKEMPESLNLIIVIGESARQQNHQIYGYERETTPNILNMVNGKEKDIFAFNYDTTSCATYTSFSVPCMLSPLNKKQFEVPMAHKGILTVFDIFGFNKYWITTQIGYTDNWYKYNYLMADSYLIRENLLKEVVGHQELLDTAMLPHIKKWLESSKLKRRVFIVHIQGSHVAFKARYPKEFEKFKSTNTTDNIKDNAAKSTDKEAYDNSILFTDYFLQELVNMFKDKGPMLLLYTSDHGENLGEVYNGRQYIGHGADYELKKGAEVVIDQSSLVDFTPPEQYKVPMYLIFNNDFINAYNLDIEDMKMLSKKPASHDNVFSTVLDCIGLSGHYIQKDKSLCVFK